VESLNASQQQETTSFRDSAALYSVDMEAERDPSYNDGSTEEVPIASFLERPVKIHSRVWSVGYTTSNTDAIFDPWVLWQSDVRVRDKLANYAYASFDLKVRFLINGSPFQYGRMMAVYIPYGDAVVDTNPRNNRQQIAGMQQQFYKTNATGAKEVTFQHFSTYPHVMLDPSTNQTMEMVLPFVWHHNYIAIPGIYGTAKESLGTIQLYDINPLRIANTNAPTSVSITVYAWATNVKLAVPTEYEPTSGRVGATKGVVNDEYNDGPISGMSSSVARLAGKLSNVPVIGKYATATRIAAGGISDVARLFGFSAPAMVENPTRTELKQHGRLANTLGEDSSTSLALDPKQEITVDPRTVGVRATDEMSISSIVTREQFLARCEWKGSGGQFTTPGAETLIFASLVCPNQVHRTGANTSGVSQVMDCPGGYIANMFSFWKGSITYRIEVVSTRMHSGRLKLQFDPMTSTAAPTVSEVVSEDVNARYTTILDLKEGCETEFTIGYNNRSPWLHTTDDYSGSTFTPVNTAVTTFDLHTGFDQRVHMGIFTVTVVNELVSPIETNAAADATHAPVMVNVYVKMGPDMQFAQPSEQGVGWGDFNFYSGTSESTNLSTLQTHGKVEIAEETAVEPDIAPGNNVVFFGEEITSIRSLIKRYCIVFGGRYDHNPGGDVVKIATRFVAHVNPPPMPGKTRRHSFLSYLAPSFLIGRGSTRYKFTTVNIYSPASATYVGYTGMDSCQWVDRWDSRTEIASLGGSVQADTLGVSTLHATIPPGYNGQGFSSGTYNPTLEVQLPFYSNTRFFLTTHIINVDNDVNETLKLNPAMDQILCAKDVYCCFSANRILQTQHFSAGDDFSLHFFLGVPGVYYT